MNIIDVMPKDDHAHSLVIIDGGNWTFPWPVAWVALLDRGRWLELGDHRSRNEAWDLAEQTIATKHRWSAS